MIKGWKNNPEWVKFYAQRDAERLARLTEVRLMAIEDNVRARMASNLISCNIYKDLKHPHSTM